MKRLTRFLVGVLGAWMVASCGTPASVPSPLATTPLPPTVTTPVPSTATVPPTHDALPVEVAGEPVPFPLSEPGPYYTGKRTFTFEDPGRDGRPIRVTVFYPALRPEGSTGPKELAGTNRDPDLGGAPYPLILTEPDTGGRIFQAHLATHGFVMAIVSGPIADEDCWGFQVIDVPRDFLFALDRMASTPLEGLERVIDFGRVGVAGYSYGGALSLTVSGVRIDPESFLTYCEQAPEMEPPLSEWYIEYTCCLADRWDDFAAYAGESITAGEDGLWRPLTDERIRAVMPMAPDGAWLFGARGLAMADRPIFIIAPTADEYTPYHIETAYIFEHVGSPERFMVSFIGRQHMMALDPEVITRFNHFAVAFFGTFLQGKGEFRLYFSEDFVTQFDDLAWGLYSEE